MLLDIKISNYLEKEYYILLMKKQVFLIVQKIPKKDKKTCYDF